MYWQQEIKLLLGLSGNSLVLVRLIEYLRRLKRFKFWSILHFVVRHFVMFRLIPLNAQWSNLYLENQKRN